PGPRTAAEPFGSLSARHANLLRTISQALSLRLTRRSDGWRCVSPSCQTTAEPCDPDTPVRCAPVADEPHQLTQVPPAQAPSGQPVGLGGAWPSSRREFWRI